jgi:hypothetical protein
VVSLGGEDILRSVIEPRPVPVFKDPAKATSPPLTDALVREAEDALGRALPASYTQLLGREANGGKLRRSLFVSEASGLEGAAHVGYLLGVGGPRGLPGLSVLADHWRYLEGGLLLNTEGPKALLLDPDDAVVYVDMTHREGELRATLAPSFAEFLEGLVDGTPSWDWVLAAELTLRDARACLEDAGWTHEGNHYGIHSLRREGLELRLGPNQERDGEGVAYSEHPECPLIAQLRGDYVHCQQALGGIDAAWGDAALRVCDRHPASVDPDS